MNEIMRLWLEAHPDASPSDAFKAGWMCCTEAWCHGKRELMERVRELIKEIIE